MKSIIGNLFSNEELQEIRSKFKYVDRDFEGTKRLFFDNAGGSLRLIRAEEEFKRVDEFPDASEHSNKMAHYLKDIENRGKEDIKSVIFNAKDGVIYPGLTASQIMMEVIRIISDNAKGTNYVTTILEHPSAFDAMTYYSNKHGCELRVAGVSAVTGGVDVETITSLIDSNTAILCCMAASNISGYIFDIEKIFKRAQEINPDIYIVCDTVQHAPHGVLDPEMLGIDAMNIAPYKFFGVRGLGIAYLSNRIASFEHNRILEKAADCWEVGSPSPAHYAAITEVVNYVTDLGSKIANGESSRRRLFELGMKRIADHERVLLNIMLEGTENVAGLRHMKGLTVKMDGQDLNARDIILGIEFDNMSCEQGVAELEKRNVVTFERSTTCIYSKRMVEAFHSNGVIRISPLHVNTPEEMEEFLKIAQEVANLQN